MRSASGVQRVPLAGGRRSIRSGSIRALDFFGGEGLRDRDGWLFESGVDLLLGRSGPGAPESGSNGL